VLRVPRASPTLLRLQDRRFLDYFIWCVILESAISAPADVDIQVACRLTTSPDPDFPCNIGSCSVFIWCPPTQPVTESPHHVDSIPAPPPPNILARHFGSSATACLLTRRRTNRSRHLGACVLGTRDADLPWTCLDGLPITNFLLVRDEHPCRPFVFTTFTDFTNAGEKGPTASLPS
jgi:hypothetical protein